MVPTEPTRRAAVLGKPIAHSLSPVLHNAGYVAAGLAGWEYTKIECDEGELAGRVAVLGPEWAGLSLTMPLKEVALAVAEVVDPFAAVLGAANTLVRRGDGWHAYNTDAPGIVRALKDVGVDRAGALAVLGGGGTARAAIGAAVSLGATVTVYTRRPEAAEELRPVAEALGVPFTGRPWAEAASARAVDVVLSTVPKGVADGFADVPWAAGTVVFDAVYDPWPTPLAAGAVARGCRLVSGLDLLLWQAIEQFELFTGVDAPAGEMRAALHGARSRP